MIYAFLCEDRENSLEARRLHRPAHLERLVALKDQGRLLLAGPHPAIDSMDPGTAGFTGSLIVAEFPSLQEAREWADAEPFLKNGVYKSVNVKPLIKVLP
ncbi:MAG: YciI family protein [Gammaproteobacteria bacterium]|nr:YciI family protein [Gammaproteobacteria bacterium]